MKYRVSSFYDKKEKKQFWFVEFRTKTLLGRLFNWNLFKWAKLKKTISNYYYYDEMVYYFSTYDEANDYVSKLIHDERNEKIIKKWEDSGLLDGIAEFTNKKLEERIREINEI